MSHYVTSILLSLRHIFPHCPTHHADQYRKSRSCREVSENPNPLLEDTIENDASDLVCVCVGPRQPRLRTGQSPQEEESSWPSSTMLEVMRVVELVVMVLGPSVRVGRFARVCRGLGRLLVAGVSSNGTILREY